MTADELWALAKDGQRHELVQGELRTMAPAGFEHGGVSINLSTPMDVHARANDLGLVVGSETGFLIERNPDTVRAPDVGFVSKGRLRSTGIPQKYFPGAPDAAAEVVSPGDTINEVDAKVQQWLDAGTRLVWVINPRRREVTVYALGARPVVLTEADVLDGQDVIPGFRIAVKDLFFAK
jgi:Uma2 family endonuclease